MLGSSVFEHTQKIMSWAVQLWLQLLPLCQCDDWIFYDLRSEDLTPDDGKWCQEQLPSTCIADFHIGRAEFSQQHREAQETLKHLREGTEDFKANQPTLRCIRAPKRFTQE